MHANKLPILATILTLAACGSPDKGKPELATDPGKTFDAVHTASGDWHLLRTIESPHPYANDLERLWQVNGAPDTTEMRVVFERLELETGYDYLFVSDAGGAQLTEHTGTRTGEEIVLTGNSVELFLQTDYSVTRWGFRVSVYDRDTSCACARIYEPVCGVDGATYGNACEAGCAGAAIAFRSPCQGDPWLQLTRSVESPHDYTNDYDNSWTITEGGARFIRLHFPRIDVERGYDFLIVKDGAGNTVARYTGAVQDVLTPPIAGDTAVVQLVSDYSVTRWGFAMDRYDVIGGCVSDADCGSGLSCNTQIQCIRAPCWSVCEPAQGSYADVGLDDLAANPNAWNGRKVRIFGEPKAGLAVCTEIACSPANACCNSCSAGLEVGSGIALRGADDSFLGCQGNSCDWQSTCNPFPAQNAGLYQMSGTFLVDAYGNSRFLIDDFAAAACIPAGCSGQICSNGGNVFTTCEFRPEYACYQTATCDVQPDGHCGWTPTPELQACLGNAGGDRFVSNDTPVAIPDNDPAGAVSRIQIPTTGALSQLLVSVDIRHTYRGDLLVTLVAPTGERFALHDGSGGSAHDLIFSDRAVDVAGLERSGEWTLLVVDRYSRDTGTIEAFELVAQ